MKIVKVLNQYMYNSKNPKGYHYYAFYWNGKYKCYNAVLLTHISNKDSKRYNQVDHGIIKNIRLKKLDKYADSGITKFNYISDVYGNKLNPKMGLIVDNKVSSYSSKVIKSQIKQNVYKGK